MAQIEPITVVISRKVKPGREADYEKWIKEITKIALQYEGHLGMNIFKPMRAGEPYVLIYKFDSGEHLDKWLASDVRIRMVKVAEEMCEESRVEQTGGLESWFTLPGATATIAPPKWKMAVVTGTCVWLMGMAIGAPLRHALESYVPQPVVALITTAIMVALLTWIVMPNLTRLLRRWLFVRSG